MKHRIAWIIIFAAAMAFGYYMLDGNGLIIFGDEKP